MGKRNWKEASAEPYCLVLGGGGAKGVYHIGVWRALKELQVPIQAFVGNSIGAVMGAFLALGKDRELEEIADTIGLDKILKIPQDLVQDGKFNWKRGSWKTFRALFQEIREKGGLDTTPMREALEKHIDEEALRSGDQDFGLVTVNLSERKPRELFLEDIPQGTLVDFLLASSAFPGFAGPDIEGKRYIDGGLHDNLPFEMARKRGYHRFIVVDISAGANARKLDFSRTETILITSREKMGGLLSFDKEFLYNYTQLGYLDTLKSFGYLQGETVFLETRPEENAEFLLDQDVHHIKELLPEEYRLTKHLLSAFMELTILVLGLERVRIWKIDSLKEAAREHLQEVSMGLKELKRENWSDLEKRIRGELEDGKLIQSPVFYHSLARDFLSGKLREWVIQQLEKRVRGLRSVLYFLEWMEIG